VSNLDTATQNGVAWCTVKDNRNENVNRELIVENSEQSFELAPQQSTSFFFSLKVPAEGLERLDITMGARSASYGDAEYHEVPVLSREILVSHTQPIQIVGKDTVVRAPVNIPDGKWYGTSISLNPPPSENLLEALRYTSNFPFNCAEQLTNKIYASLVAANLLRKDSSLRSAFSEWSKAMKEPGNTNGDAFGNLSRPWLSLQEDEWKRQNELFYLFDASAGQIRLKKQIAELKMLQTTDGGMSWFPGGSSNAPISFYVLRKLGEMKKLNLFSEMPESEQKEITQIVDKLMEYAEPRLRNSADIMDKELFENMLLARSYWIPEYPVRDSILQFWRKKIDLSLSNLKERGPGTVGPILLASFQFGDSLFTKVEVEDIVENLKSRAINDDKNGIRWREYSNNPLPSTTKMEGLSAVLRAFEKIDHTDKWAPGIQRWLQQKRWPLTWPNTRFASAYISMMQDASVNSTESEPSLEWMQGSTAKVLSTATTGRSSSMFRKAILAEPKVSLRKLGTGISNPTLVWHYFSSEPDSAHSAAGLHVSQSLLLWNKNLEQWVAMDSTVDLEIGDKVLLQLKIHSNKLLEYVQIETFFPACLSSTDGRSRRIYFNGGSGYMSVRDERLDIFADRIDEGDAIISFEMKVEKKGEFYYRPSVLRCMYAMEISAYGKGGVLRVR
jgi:hypothetical protein